MAQPDFKTVTTAEWGVGGGAFVAFIGLFFHAYGVSFKGGSEFAGLGVSEHVSGWHFAGLWLPVFLLLAAAALVAVRRFRGDLIPTTLPVGTRVVVAAVAALATLIIIIRVISYPGSGSGYSAGASFGSYLILLAALVATVFAVLDFRASGEKLPTLPSKPAETPPTS